MYRQQSHVVAAGLCMVTGRSILTKLASVLCVPRVGLEEGGVRLCASCVTCICASIPASSCITKGKKRVAEWYVGRVYNSSIDEERQPQVASSACRHARAYPARKGFANCICVFYCCAISFVLLCEGGFAELVSGENCGHSSLCHCSMVVTTSSAFALIA